MCNSQQDEEQEDGCLAPSQLPSSDPEKTVIKSLLLLHSELDTSVEVSWMQSDEMFNLLISTVPCYTRKRNLFFFKKAAHPL